MSKRRDLRIYGAEYKLWRDGIFLGTAKWTDDKNIGNAFMRETVRNGQPAYDVFEADEWELILKQNG